VALLSAATLAYTAPDDWDRNFVKSWNTLMNEWGRKYEVHYVVTPQEWELTLFRIMPDPKAVSDVTGRSVLF